VLTLLVPPAQVVAVDDSVPSAGPEEPNLTSPLSWWERLAMGVNGVDGLVVLDQGAGGPRELAREVRLSGSVARGTVTYALDFRSGSKRGHLQAQGFVNLPTISQSFLDELVSRTNISVQDLDLAPFLDLAASRGSWPTGEGTLNATLHVSTAGLEEVKLQGDVALRALHLEGGWLGADRPALDALSASFHGTRSRKEGWRFENLRVDSEPLRLQGQGQLNSRSVDLSASGTVHLPVVAAQLPHLLALHQDTVVREGVLDFSVSASGRPEDLQARAAWRAHRLRAVHKGQHFSWDAPLMLSAEIEHRQGVTRARDIRLHTPYLQGAGRGGVEDFTFEASADLQQMSQELEKLFVLPYSGRGKMQWYGSSRREQDGTFRLSSRIDVGGLAVFKDGRIVMPDYDFFLESEIATAPGFVRNRRLTGLQARTIFWPGQLSLTLGNIDKQTAGLQAALSVDGILSLERTGLLLHRFEPGGLPPLRGRLAFAGKGAISGQRLVVEELNGQVDGLAVQSGRFDYQPPEFTFGLEPRGLAGREAVTVRQLVVAANWRELAEQDRAVAIVDYGRGLLDLRHLAIRIGGLSARGGLHVGDWRQPEPDLAAEIDLVGEAGPLADLGRAGGFFAEDMQARGQVRAGIAVVAGKDQPQRTDLDVQIDDVELLQAGQRVFRDRQLRCELRSEGVFGTDQDVRILAFQLHSTPLQAEGAGRMTGGGATVLELSGSLTPDLALLSDPLTATIGQRVRLSGRRPAEFRLSWPLERPMRLDRIALSTTLQAETMQFRSIGLRSIDLPVDIGKGSLRALIAGDLYAGRIALQPSWQFSRIPPQITIPPNARALVGVDVQSPLSSGLLVYVHPLFGSLTRAEGSVDLRLDAFQWPLQKGAAGRPSFAVTLGLNELRLQPAQETAAALRLAGLDRQALELLSRELSCQGRDGRIRCTPLRLRSGATEMRLSGVSGMDGALDYRLELPATRQLVGEQGAALLRSVNVEAPFNGTIMAPRFDRQAFQVAVTAQMRRAATQQRRLEAAGKPAAEQPPGETH
ncbi:MAG: DUF748 domain-containing protein, partial [Desulfobulbus sp.]|nr:DUF748 domain-containing protein [Desulfobulbus sp.]